MFKSVQSITQSNHLERPFRDCQVSLGKVTGPLRKLPLPCCFLERFRCVGGRVVIDVSAVKGRHMLADPTGWLRSPYQSAVDGMYGPVPRA